MFAIESESFGVKGALGFCLPLTVGEEKTSFRKLRTFAMREKGGNHLVPSLDYMADALKFPNQTSRGSGESLKKCVDRRCPDGTQHFLC
ncbi:hypothetical protein TNCV_1686571 [Trichonephila clavipes]|nr:hypothetical protein TNCV_1686571 [Trichonephila clavipes]